MKTRKRKAQPPTMAARALSEIQSRDVTVTIEPRSEVVGSGVSIVPRLALSGGKQMPGDYERLGRYRVGIIAILEAAGAFGNGLENDGGDAPFERKRISIPNSTGRGARGTK